MAAPRSLLRGVITGGLLWTAGALLPGMAEGNERWFAVLCVLGLLLMAVGLVWIGASLRPLSLVRGRLSMLRSGADKELTGAYPAELQPLVDDLNELLRRNREALAGSRLEADSLAHALKTSLTVLGNDLRDLEASGHPEVASLLRQVEVMTSRTELYLSRARAAAARFAYPESASCCVRSTVEGLTRVMGRLHSDPGLRLETRIEPGTSFRGDDEDLSEMLGNLLDNALKWARGRVVIGARTEDGRIAIVVDDDGKGLASSDRARVLRRGGRLDEATPGTGVGLTIVQGLVELYGGRLELTTAPMGGLRAELDLPAGNLPPPGPDSSKGLRTLREE